MAMRLYTRDEFEEELVQKWNLTPTEERTETTRFWMTPNGKHISVPILPGGTRYPDYYIDEIERRLSALGENPFNRPADGISPTVSPGA